MEGLTAPVELDEDEGIGLERLLLLVLDDWEFLAAEVGVLLGSGAFRLLPLVGRAVPLFGFFCKNCSMPMSGYLKESWATVGSDGASCSKITDQSQIHLQRRTNKVRGGNFCWLLYQSQI